ncbi:MAG: PRC-barrel domain-containing protein [Bacillus sp. (in: firmicutes)]
MRTFSLLKGLPVLNEEQHRIGTICDLAISGEGIVTGLLMKRNAMFTKNCLIPLSDVLAYDKRSLTIRSTAQLKPFKQLMAYTFAHKQAIANKMIVDGDGERLGLLEDVYFSERAGRIVAYEISNGFFSDITEGKRMIHTAEPPSFKGDTIVIS